jgi:hypothetical protein
VYFELFLGRKIMKKYLFAVAILVMVVAASGCTSQNGNSTSTKSYAANGISFNYSSDWIIINDTTNENGTVIVLGDADIKKNDSVKGNGVNILKIPQSANATAGLKVLKTQFAKLNGTNGTANIAGVTANETTFNVKGNNVTAQIKIIDFAKNNYIYILQYTTVASDFKTQQQLFDLITNSFQVQ